MGATGKSVGGYRRATIVLRRVGEMTEIFSKLHFMVEKKNANVIITCVWINSAGLVPVSVNHKTGGVEMVKRRCLVSGVVVFATTFLFAATAAEYYVATNGVDEVGRGSEASPFQTIQYAIDSASAGSTIWVKPGTYDKGGAENASASGVHSNRVVLTKKIHLKSTDGAAVTHIVGAPDPATGGVGPNAVRCVVSPNNNSADSTITGFTLRDGYGDDGSQAHRSGGFLRIFHIS